MSAFPKPSVSLSVQSGSTIHVGDTVQFALNATTGRQLTYRWDFGDGSDILPQSSDTARHTYSDYGHYDITVTATDPIEQEASDSASVEVLPLPPHASLATPTPDATDPLTIDFDASASTGAQLSYRWDFGDNDVEVANAQIAHQYANPGIYTVTLTITDVANQTDTASAQVTIQIAGPVARFTSSQYYYDSYYPYACYDFDASSSTGYNLSYSSFSWSFGDGSGSSGQTTSDCFYGGYYAVRLQVTDALGQTSAITHYISV